MTYRRPVGVVAAITACNFHIAVPSWKIIPALVCGAISRPQEALILAHGLTVVPFVSGELREVVAAWRTGRLASDTFAMPGCGRGQGRRFRGGRGWGRELRGRHRGGAMRRRFMD